MHLEVSRTAHRAHESLSANCQSYAAASVTSLLYSIYPVISYTTKI